ncbi:hypothetical protein DL93DRAFT_2099283 [Clavulina sp. PMI_390]|nr:hypothetical protein DL93DRAFT_2099283 [Clavulina sp. PMI_390]
MTGALQNAQKHTPAYQDRPQIAELEDATSKRPASILVEDPAPSRQHAKSPQRIKERVDLPNDAVDLPRSSNPLGTADGFASGMTDQNQSLRTVVIRVQMLELPPPGIGPKAALPSNNPGNLKILAGSQCGSVVPKYPKASTGIITQRF